MRIQIAHYGGYLMKAIDNYSRRQLRQGGVLRKEIGAGGSLLKHQTFRCYCAAERLLCMELRHINSWSRLIWASKISRRRAKKASTAA